MREADANETWQTRLCIWGAVPVESSILFCLVSVDLEYHDGWCVLKSPRIRVSGVIRRGFIED